MRASLDGQGVQENDYGTMVGKSKKDSVRTRPGFERTDTDTSHASFFKDPVW